MTLYFDVFAALVFGPSPDLLAARMSLCFFGTSQSVLTTRFLFTTHPTKWRAWCSTLQGLDLCLSCATQPRLYSEKTMLLLADTSSIWQSSRREMFRLSKERLILSFAPKTWCSLHWRPKFLPGTTLCWRESENYFQESQKPPVTWTVLARFCDRRSTFASGASKHPPIHKSSPGHVKGVLTCEVPTFMMKPMLKLHWKQLVTRPGIKTIPRSQWPCNRSLVDQLVCPHKVTRKDMTSTNFYFSRLFEARKHTRDWFWVCLNMFQCHCITLPLHSTTCHYMPLQYQSHQTLSWGTTSLKIVEPGLEMRFAWNLVAWKAATLL